MEDNRCGAGSQVNNLPWPGLASGPAYLGPTFPSDVPRNFKKLTANGRGLENCGSGVFVEWEFRVLVGKAKAGGKVRPG